MCDIAALVCWCESACVLCIDDLPEIYVITT